MDCVLLDHLNRVEDKLLAEFNISQTAGHPVNKGTPREIFIKDFLKNHVGQNVAIGSGEIIDSASIRNESRNQFDIVIYKNTFPKLHIADDINAFLIESVAVTIEVKSNLTKDGLRQAIIASINSKKLIPNLNITLSAGYIPPAVINLLVAYSGPKEMTTILKWLKEIYNELGLKDSRKYISDEQRMKLPSFSLDGIIILKRGFIFFDNMSLSFRKMPEVTIESPSFFEWVYSNTESGNLLMLFLIIIQATQNLTAAFLNPIPYIQEFRTNVSRVHF